MPSKPPAAPRAPRRKVDPPTNLTLRQEIALKFVNGLLAGPSGASALKGDTEAALAQISRLGLKFADAFLAESS